MRFTQLLLVVTLLAATLPVAEAQQGDFLQDEVGDHTYAVGGIEQNKDDWPMLDLISADIAEDKDGFTFLLEVDELDPTEVEVNVFGRFGGVQYLFHFTYGEQMYRIQMIRFIQQGDVFIWTQFQKWEEGREWWDTIRQPDTEWSIDSDTITISIDRDDVIDENGSPPQKGLTLTDVYARSRVDGDVGFWFVPSTDVLSGGDRMPNEGLIGAVYEFTYGLDQTGHAWLWSDKPVRVSNGEATTFLYTVTATNKAERTDTFVFKVDQPPKDWVVTFPEGKLRLDAGEVLDVPVLITVPFQHQHGLFTPVRIEMVSQSDPLAVGRVELGVRYTEVPQPAGHHDTLYFHSGETQEFGPFVGTEGYFNTVEDYEFDSNGPIHPDRTDCGVTTIQHRWYLDLNPGLQMGLDFDLDRVGTLEFPLKVEIPSPAAVISGRLDRYATNEESRQGFGGGGGGNDEETRVAELPGITLGDLSQGQTVNVKMDITPTEFGDYLPDTEESRLVMRLDMRYTSPAAGLFFGGCSRPGEMEPTIQPGGWFQLPLNEFHDDVDDFFSALSGIELYTLGKQQRFVNPGNTVLFNITAENIGSQAGKYRFELTGRNPEWARVLGPREISIAAGRSAPVIMAVTAPNAAPDSELADITLHATKVDDANIRSLIRVLVEVDTDAQHADEAALAGELEDGLKQKKSPGLSVALLGLAALALARRRS